MFLLSMTRDMCMLKKAVFGRSRMGEMVPCAWSGMDSKKVKSKTYNQQSLESNHDDPCSKAGILHFLLNAKGRILFCNVTAREALGYEHDEITGKNFLVLFEKSESKSIQKQLDMCLNRGYVRNVDTAIRRSDGRPLYIRLNGLTENDEKGNPKTVRIYIQDITEIARARRERQLALRLAQHAQNADPSPQAVKQMLSEILAVMGGETAALFLVNDQGKRFVLRYPREQAKDRERLDTWPPDMGERILKLCKESDAGHFTGRGSYWTDDLSELAARIRPGPERDHLAKLQELGFLMLIPFKSPSGARGVFAMAHGVVGALNESDVAFLETQIPLLSCFQTKSEPGTPTGETDEASESVMDVPILGMLKVRNGIVLSVNQWIEAFLGYSRKEIIGKAMLDFIDEAYHEMLSQMSSGESGTDDTPDRCEAVAVTKTGQRRWMTCTRVRLPTSGNSDALWYWIHQHDRDQLKDQLLQARKMESLGMLAGGIVHDFNNLLASILGYSSMLSEEIPPDSPYYEDIQQINRTAERSAELTIRLMAHAQGGAFIVDDLIVNQLIKEVAGILSRTLDKSISIRADLAPDLWVLKADASQIQQAILQVALNARDAMTEGGKIVFQTRNFILEESGAWERLGGKPGRYVQIAINDTGSGMTGPVKERIFEPSFTTKDRTAGKGLGLSMVRDIVENHGGFISVFSEQGKGTVVKIHLPVVEEEATPSRTTTDEKPASGQETILLVDSERILRETAYKMLTRYGYKVMGAESGPEAVALYKKYASNIDLIILDLLVPGMQIDKVLAWMKKLNPEAKIIASMDLGNERNLRDGFEQVISDYVQKPFQVRPLLRTVRSVLNA